jgi:hypothetical protein
LGHWNRQLATISIGAIYCLFVNSGNRRCLKYLILLIFGSSEKGGKIAESSAEGARAIRIDIGKVLATISIGGILCFFCKFLQSQILEVFNSAHF